MLILSIETSCDETALAILDCKGGLLKPSFKVLAETVHSQTKIHEQYGGVFPMMAKREHQKNLIPLLIKVLKKSNFFGELRITNDELRIKTLRAKFKMIFEREAGLLEQFDKFICQIKKPKIDAIAVTSGPGLEPTLWVGINFARALGLLWNIPVIPVNHMEGHFFSVLVNKKKKGSVTNFHYPALALLISGGHTELVLSKKPLSYKILGATRDDAVGEAFDKVARILGLPYPGGPQISALAEISRKNTDKTQTFVEKKQNAKHNIQNTISLPRPMIHSKDLDFSFSGLKTAVLYLVQRLVTSHSPLTTSTRESIALEFENAVADVLVTKTRKAIEKYHPVTLIVAGGVSANTHIKKELNKLKKEFKWLQILFPDKKQTGDNAVMIGVAGYMKVASAKWRVTSKKIQAEGNLKIGN